MRFNVFALVACAVSTVALTISSPDQDAKVDLSKPYEIKWKNVESDPTMFNIQLVNMNGGSNSTNVHKEVAKDVKASEGSYTIKPVWGVQKGKEYQFNFIREDKKNTGILAQSQHFEVTNVAERPQSGKKKRSCSTTITTPAAPRSPHHHCTCTNTKVSISTTTPPPTTFTQLSTTTTTTSAPLFNPPPNTNYHIPIITPYSAPSPSSSTAPSSSRPLASPSSTGTSASSTPTESSAASPAVAVPVAGSLLMTLFAFAL